MFTIEGEYSVKMLQDAFGVSTGTGALEEAYGTSAVADAPGRPPLLCAGCPHKGLFYVLNRLKKTVMGDIDVYKRQHNRC